MPNSISTDQNADRQWERLAAQQHLYSKAKKILAAQMITIPLAIVMAGVVYFFPKLRVWSVFYGLAVSILDATILDYFQKGLRQTAAKVQEVFDCELLSIPWSKVKVGLRPDQEVIIEAAEKYKRTDPQLTRIRDWYPQSVEGVPLEMARLLCQRANCRWDMELRERYANWIMVTLFSLAVIVFLIGLAGGLSFESVVLVILAPLTPALLWGIREYRNQRETAATSRRLKEQISELWSNAIAGKLSAKELAGESRALQDQIYDRRRNSPLVFDWIYNLSREQREFEMKKTADRFVEDARKAIEAGKIKPTVN